MRARAIAQSQNQPKKISMLLSDLGDVALAQRRFEEARSLYQQALDIKIEFGDRYSQASTYNGLGLLAEAQENYEEASSQLLKALEIFVEFDDSHNIKIVKNNLKRIYQITQSAALLSAVATTLKTSIEEVQASFQANDEP